MTDKSSLQVVTVASEIDERINVLQDSCSENGLSLKILGEGVTWTSYLLKLKILKEHLQTIDGEQLIVFVDAFDVFVASDEQKIISTFESFKTNIVFAAESNFLFRDVPLRYYYWKYYPRPHKYYNYLNSGTYIGRSRHLLLMIDEICENYQINLDDEEQLKKLPNCDQTFFSRYFVDRYHQGITSENSITLDYDQQIFACTGGRHAVTGLGKLSWIQSFLFFRYERRLLKVFGLQEYQNTILDIKYAKDRFINVKTGTNPLVLHLPRTEKRIADIIKRKKSHSINMRAFHPVALMISSVAWLQSFFTWLLVLVVNVGNSDPKRIFRYTQNNNPEFDHSIKTLLKNLQTGVPFSFAHFNDGELTFIKKFIDRKTRKTSYGRGQQTYDDKLGERLHDSIQKALPNYMVGIPCSTCWPQHRKLADELTSEKVETAPAMIFHHNLSFLPAIVNALKERDLFFISNEQQDFSTLRKLGLTIDEAQRTNVPFKNSYELFELLKDREFPPDSVVILTCGMLAKILIPYWYEHNPKTTLIAFGSSLDDLIQREKMRFLLFPKFLPFTSNIYPTKYFLFGRKKICKECYPNPAV